jgi:glycosyltransferase involved in cell wall biosynthesis
MDVLKEKGAMKVLLLAPLPPPNGGIASWAVRMLESNAANRWGFEVVDEKVIKRDVFGSRKKNNLFIELKRTLMIWWNLWRRLKDKSFLVVHSNIPALPKSIIRELGSLAISKIKKRKFIVHYHCTVPNLVKGKLRSLLFRILSNNSDAIIVLNTPSKAFSEEISNTPVFLIPNFINQHENNR